MKLFDFQHEFFNPLRRRIVCVAVCFSWGIVEFVTNAPFWGVIFVGISGVAAWQFFVKWSGDQPK